MRHQRVAETLKMLPFPKQIKHSAGSYFQEVVDSLDENVAIPLLLLGTLPQAKAQVDPEVLKMCVSS